MECVPWKGYVGYLLLKRDNIFQDHLYIIRKQKKWWLKARTSFNHTWMASIILKRDWRSKYCRVNSYSGFNGAPLRRTFINFFSIHNRHLNFHIPDLFWCNDKEVFT